MSRQKVAPEAGAAAQVREPAIVCVVATSPGWRVVVRYRDRKQAEDPEPIVAWALHQNGELEPLVANGGTFLRLSDSELIERILSPLEVSP
jgi:hypothetical protein